MTGRQKLAVWVGLVVVIDGGIFALLFLASRMGGQ